MYILLTDIDGDCAFRPLNYICFSN